MQKGFGTVYILLGILVLGLVAGGAYYLGKSNTTPQLPTPAPFYPPPSSTPPTPPDKNLPVLNKTPDKITDWKIYRDNSFKFSINYPNDWEEYSYNGEIFFRPFSLNSFAISIGPHLLKGFDYPLYEKFIKGFFDNEGREVNNIEVDGRNGTKVTGYTNGDKQEIVLFASDNFAYEIQSSSGEFVLFLDQMLSTFKFIN